MRGVRLQQDVNDIPRLVESQIDESGSEVRFDLRGLTSIRPGPLTALAARASTITHANRRLRISLPTDSECCQYLEEISGLCWYLSSDSAIQFEGKQCPGAFTYAVKDTMLSMTRITNHSEADSIAEEMFEGFRRVGGPAGWIMHEISDGLQEPANNAVEHARSDIGAVCIAKTRQTRNGRFAEVAVADTGIGIWRSLRSRYPTLSSHAAAIEKALEDGVTSTDDAYRGRGLWETHQLSQVSDRRLTIVSGDGCVVATPTGTGQYPLANSWSGTVVSLHFPLGR